LEEDHLCPPIPNRFFYLHWIHSELLQKDHGTFGLDIGAGASCVYPLLAARHFRSIIFTTEIDPKAATIAKSNVNANHLNNFIHVMDVVPSYAQQHQQGHTCQPGGPLHRAELAMEAVQQQQKLSTSQPLDFVMTNPPFYDPADQTMHARAGDGRDRTNMTVNEGTYPGGEVGFVLDLIADSLRIISPQRNNLIQPTTWISSMLGKKTSLVKLQKILTHLMGPAHIRVTEYGPGQYTRWFLAWTLEQPIAKNPEAKAPPHDHDSFQLSLSTLQEQEGRNISRNDAIDITIQRILAYCESSPGGWDLSAQVISRDDSGAGLVTLQIQESMPLAISNYVDETVADVDMPQVILDALHEYNHPFLPDEGHFLIIVHVKHTKSDDDDFFTVQLELFRHSSRGTKAIERIRSTLEGDVCRTNRKWRKIRQRQQEVQQRL
jgi:23S rRNA A1618 N6-methylase RlmF